MEGLSSGESLETPYSYTAERGGSGLVLLPGMWVDKRREEASYTVRGCWLADLAVTRAMRT